MTRAVLVAALLVLAIGWHRGLPGGRPPARCIDAHRAWATPAFRDDQTFAAIEAYSGAIARRSTRCSPTSGVAKPTSSARSRRPRRWRRATSARRPSLDPDRRRGRSRNSGDASVPAASLATARPRRTERCARHRRPVAARRLQAGARAVSRRRLRRRHGQPPSRRFALDDRIGGRLLPARPLPARERAVDGRCAGGARTGRLPSNPASIPVREELAELYALGRSPPDELEQLQLLAGLRSDADRAAGGFGHGARPRSPPRRARGPHPEQRPRADAERASRSTPRSAVSGWMARARAMTAPRSSKRSRRCRARHRIRTRAAEVLTPTAARAAARR